MGDWQDALSAMDDGIFAGLGAVEVTLAAWGGGTPGTVQGIVHEERMRFDEPGEAGVSEEWMAEVDVRRAALLEVLGRDAEGGDVLTLPSGRTYRVTDFGMDESVVSLVGTAIVDRTRMPDPGQKR